MAPVKHRIFVSHSHLDNDFGNKLAQDLRRVLADEDAVFYDVLGLHGGEFWWERIVEELTERDVFLLVLSPDAMYSRWVRQEINIAFNRNKYITPLHHRKCDIRADLEIRQIISFLAPKPYEAAFQEVVSTLGLPQEIPIVQRESVSQLNEPIDSTSILIQQMESAFADHDWPDVIRKATYLIKRTSGNISSAVYRLQGVALAEEGDVQQAQEALETALALVSDRGQRLTLLSDYTALLAQQEQWARVLQQSREALRLAPNDPGWLATQQQAQSQLTPKAAVASPSQKKTPTTDRQPSPLPLKTKEQWLDEGNALINLKRDEEAIVAYEQAIRLDPNFAFAYIGKGTALYDLKRDEEALASYEQAIRLDPNYADAYYNKGAAFYYLTRYEEAIAAYDQAIRLDPNLAFAYYGKGMALEALKKSTEAQQAYEKARQLGYSG
ncbi:MAG TPA: tetratricopeptide repeat protein [Ktedonobacteraceae bacterium]